ncbi:Poliovirus receptor [Manis javanica]|nr:Poliovirus receptor [Manis javanica]
MNKTHSGRASDAAKQLIGTKIFQCVNEEKHPELVPTLEECRVLTGRHIEASGSVQNQACFSFQTCCSCRGPYSSPRISGTEVEFPFPPRDSSGSARSPRDSWAAAQEAGAAGRRSQDQRTPGAPGPPRNPSMAMPWGPREQGRLAKEETLLSGGADQQRKLTCWEMHSTSMLCLEPVPEARCMSSRGRPPSQIPWSSHLGGKANNSQELGLLAWLACHYQRLHLNSPKPGRW